MGENTFNYVRFLRGTQSAYNNLTEKRNDTLYFVVDSGMATGKLYLGEALISGGMSEDELISYLKDLKDVDTTNAIDGSLLGYDSVREKWVPMDPDEIFSVSIMTGASGLIDGASGLVPAPKAGENKNFLRGDGSWATVAIADVTSLQSALDSLVSLETFNTELSKKANSSDITNAINELNQIIANKADKSETYTKKETDSAIASAITKASHLQRKIVNNVQDIYDYAQENTDADRYIFMVPTGLTLDDNKYYEYITILDEDGNYSIEKVGDWEVSLENYVTTQELETALENKVDKVYYTIPVVDEDGNPVYEEDGITPKTEQVEGTLLSPNDQNKLDALVITEDGIQISGTVNAVNVQGLNEWITENRNLVPGLYSSTTEANVNKAIEDLNSLAGNVVSNTNNVTAVSTKVDSIIANLNNFVTKVEYENKMAIIETDINLLKDYMSWKSI